MRHVNFCTQDFAVYGMVDRRVFWCEIGWAFGERVGTLSPHPLSLWPVRQLRENCWVVEPFRSQEWSISNFPCSLTGNITPHSMKSLAFHSLLRWKMIILPTLTPSLYTFLFQKVGRMYRWKFLFSQFSICNLVCLSITTKLIQHTQTSELITG